MLAATRGKSSSGELIESVNPATAEIVSKAQASNVTDAKSAVDSARIAFESGVWGEDPNRRSKALYALARRLSESVTHMAELLVRESGKIYDDAISEITRSSLPLEYYSGVARNVFGRSILLGPKTMSVLLREPIGVVSIIVPWNAPIALLVRSLAPALAAGNTIVIKPPPFGSNPNAPFFGEPGVEEDHIVEMLRSMGYRIELEERACWAGNRRWSEL